MFLFRQSEIYEKLHRVEDSFFTVSMPIIRAIQGLLRSQGQRFFLIHE